MSEAGLTLVGHPHPLIIRPVKVETVWTGGHFMSFDAPLRLAWAMENALHLFATLGNTIVEQVGMDDGDFFKFPNN